MASLLFENLQEFCRICLKSLHTDDEATLSANSYNIYLMPNLKKTFAALSVEIENELYPNAVCGICYTKLQDFHEFRTTILCSNRILSDMLHLAIETDSDNKTAQEPDDATVEVQPEEDIETAPCEWVKFDMDNGCEEVELADVQEPQYNDDDFQFADHIEVEEIFEEPLLLGVEDELDGIDECTVEIGNEIIYSDAANDENIDGEVQTVDVVVPNEAAESTTDMCLSSSQQKNQKRGETKYHCEQCPPRWFLTQENLDAHKRTHAGLRPFACNECERSFNVASQLRVHVREDHSDNPDANVCPYEGCGKAFTKSGSLKTHVRYKHSKSIPFICEDCGAPFKNSTKFKEHRYKHASVADYPFECPHCGKRFIAKNRFELHLVRHTGVKSFQCPYCDLQKYTRDELNAHVNTHTKERQWPCKFCPKVFNSSTNWRIHDTTVHKRIRKFDCRFCERTFGRPHTRKRHEMTHTGERPCVCHICDKRFIQATTLRAHIKTHGRPEPPPSP